MVALPVSAITGLLAFGLVWVQFSNVNNYENHRKLRQYTGCPDNGFSPTYKENIQKVVNGCRYHYNK